MPTVSEKQQRQMKDFQVWERKLKHFVVFLFKKGAQTGAWTTCSCVSWWVRRGHRYKIQTFSFKAYLEITLASKGKSGIPKRLWIKSQIMKYFLVPLSQCQLMHLSLSFQKHSLVRGWCGRFERIKGWIPAFLMLPSHAKICTARSNQSPWSLEERLSCIDSAVM